MRKETYHHENLRQTMLEAAVELIGQVGPRAFTLREVARRAGVSHNAPYRHFASKDDLLVAVAQDGFDRLTSAMLSSCEKGDTSLRRLDFCGCGYVEFALRWPHHFLVMFDLPRTLPAECDGAKVGGQAFQVLVACIVAAQESGDLPAGDPLPLALTAWSMVHGIAKLAVSGNLPLDKQGIVEFTLRAAAILSRGLIDEKRHPL